jgi:hypothetical protein
VEENEDKQLARLYDYTKFHIGIYLSFAGGIAALLGSQETGWFLSTLVKSNKYSLYAALVLMVLAGACGGVVASSTLECKTFHEFWNKDHGPQSLPFLKRHGSNWAMLEHAFFWLSLLVLGYAIAIGFATTDVSRTAKVECAHPIVCCCAASSAPVDSSK